MNEETPKPNDDESSAFEDAEQAHLNLGDTSASEDTQSPVASEDSSDEFEFADNEPLDDEAFDGHDEAFDGHDEALEHDWADSEYTTSDASSMEDEAPAASDGMSFLGHLEEFRWTIGRSLIAFVVGLVLATVFIQDIAGFLKTPIITAYGSVELVDQNLITYRPMGVISVFIQVALLSGFTLSMPFLLFFLGNFVAPGLTEQERRILKPSCLAAFVLFLLGITFAFFIILPLTLGFSVRLNQFFGFDLLWAASDYYSMVVWSSLVTGAFFQFPLLIVVLIFLQVISVQQLKRIRKIVFVVIMVFAAIMSPGGDFISLPLTTGFMYALYELAIGIGAYVERKKGLQLDE